MKHLERELACISESVIAVAIHKQTKQVAHIIAYDDDNQTPIKSLVNSMYWNSAGGNWKSGVDITKQCVFVALRSTEDKEAFTDYFNTNSLDEMYAMAKPYGYKTNP